MFYVVLAFIYVCAIIYIASGGVKRTPRTSEKGRKMDEFTFKDREGKAYTIDVCNFVEEWNENNSVDRNICFNDDDFLDMFSKSEIAENVAYGNFSPFDDFIVQDKDGYFLTSNDPFELAQYFDFTNDADFMDVMKKYRVD